MTFRNKIPSGNDYISNDIRYLFMMVYHFTKFGWVILMRIKGRYYLECFRTMIDILYKKINTDNDGELKK